MINKFQKFLIFLPGFLMLTIIVLLLKIQGDNEKLLRIEADLSNYLSNQSANSKNKTITSQPTETNQAQTSGTTEVISVPTSISAPTPASTPAPAAIPAPVKKTRAS